LATGSADETTAVAPVAPPYASQASLTIGAAVHVNGDPLAALDEVERRGLDWADYVRDALLSGSSDYANTLRSRSPRLLQEEWLGALSQQGEREAQHGAVQAEFALARLWLLSVACVAIVLSVVAGTLILRCVTQPLAQAIDHAQRISQGDLTGLIAAERSDEAGDLLAALAQMQEQLRALVGSINKLARVAYQR
jgi:methyl-accepting chemotaxis protein